MATTQIACIGQYQACGFRIWKLGDDCDVVHTSTDNAFVGTAIARANMSAEIKEGTEVEATTACGAVAWSVKDVDRIKAWNFELELALWDYEILEAAIGGALLTGGGAITPSAWAGKTIGWAAPGPDVNTQNAVAIELWSRTAYSSGTCGAADTDNPLYIRHIFPRATLQLQDRAFADGEPAYMRFQGQVTANPKLFPRLASISGAEETWLGPASTTVLENKTYVQMFSNALPAAPAVCGLVSVDVA